VPNIYANLTKLCRFLGVKTQQYDQDIVLYDDVGRFLFGYSTLHLGNFSFPLPYLQNFVTPEFWKYMWVVFSKDNCLSFFRAFIPSENNLGRIGKQES
jgi:hypothetical protein